ncbi:MAG: hypothetical protein Q8R29_01370 [bacterium]|nr:hypothetical protein [bacterium]
MNIFRDKFLVIIKEFMSYSNYKQLLDPLLKQEHKCLFSSYVHLEKPYQDCEFIYQNPSVGREEVLLLMFHLDGKEVPNFVPEIHTLAPGQSVRLNVKSELQKIGIFQFRGSVFCVVHPIDIMTEDLSQRDFVSIWSSSVTKSACHIGLGALKILNVGGRKENQQYLMYCPAVISTPEKKTLITFFNHSSEPGYADVVTLRPQLRNLRGKSVPGSEISVGPYGTFVIDVDEIFGERGVRLLQETDSRGCVVVHHRGHTFPTLFFHCHRKSRDILIGTHTNPPASITKGYATNRYWFNFFASKIPGLYVVWLIRDVFRRLKRGL